MDREFYRIYIFFIAFDLIIAGCGVVGVMSNKEAYQMGGLAQICAAIIIYILLDYQFIKEERIYQELDRLYKLRQQLLKQDESATVSLGVKLHY